MKTTITHTTLPCGCVLTTHNYLVKNIERCATCQAQWDEASRLYAEIIDQEIEDAIFKE